MKRTSRYNAMKRSRRKHYLDNFREAQRRDRECGEKPPQRAKRHVTLSPPDTERLAGCTGKVPHPDREAAARACIELRLRLGVFVQPYCCKHCGSYHVGHSREDREKERKAKERAR